MRLGLYILGFCMVVASAFWSYRMTYSTQDALNAVEALRRDIRQEREAISVLAAEWAWLNAPDRLSRLVAEQSEALALRPLAGGDFAELIEVAEPAVDDGLAPVTIIDLDALGQELAERPAPMPMPLPQQIGGGARQGGGE